MKCSATTVTSDAFIQLEPSQAHGGYPAAERACKFEQSLSEPFVYVPSHPSGSAAMPIPEHSTSFRRVFPDHEKVFPPFETFFQRPALFSGARILEQGAIWGESTRAHHLFLVGFLFVVLLLQFRTQRIHIPKTMLFLRSQLSLVHLLILSRLRPADHLGGNLRREEDSRLGVRHHHIAGKHRGATYPNRHVPIH